MTRKITARKTARRARRSNPMGDTWVVTHAPPPCSNPKRVGPSGSGVVAKYRSDDGETAQIGLSDGVYYVQFGYASGPFSSGGHASTLAKARKLIPAGFRVVRSNPPSSGSLYAGRPGFMGDKWIQPVLAPNGDIIKGNPKRGRRNPIEPMDPERFKTLKLNPVGDYEVVRFLGVRPDGRGFETETISRHASDKAAQNAFARLVTADGKLIPNHTDYAVQMSPAALRRAQKRVSKARAKAAKGNPSYRVLVEGSGTTGAVRKALKGAGFDKIRVSTRSGGGKRQAGPYALFVRDQVPKLRASGLDMSGAMQEIAKRWRAKGGAKANPSSSPKHVRIEGTRWRDGSGNTYHKAYVYIDGRLALTTPVTYGYGDQYVQTGWEAAEEQGLLPHPEKGRSGSWSPWRTAEANGIEFAYDATDVARKKDL